MKHCKHCNDTLFTEIYDTCMTCFEKQPAESTMTKTIEQYQQDALWYQNEIKRLESCCSNLQGVVKGDAYNIKRLSEENERLVKIYNDQRDILDKILFELPVGSVTSHSYENIPERVKYYVRENALLESNQDEANELISQSMPNFFDHPSAGYILDNTALLIGIADKAKIEAWGDREDLEALQEEIKTCYEYYAGFAANKNLTSFQMLDTLFKSKPGYNHVDSKQNECLVDDNRKLHAELAKCIKDTMSIENERDECKKLAVENEKLRNELQIYIKTGEIKTGVVKRQQDILDKILFELPVGNVTTHSYENIPDRVKYYVREHSSLANDWESAIDLIESSWPKFFHSDEMTITQTVKNLIKEANDGALSAWAADEATETLKEDNQNLLEKLEALKVKSRLFKSARDGQEYLRCLHQQGDNHQSVELWIADAMKYKAALEEIVKRPRKSETCRLIAQQALGLLSDDAYQPELLIEENLKLKIENENLTSRLIEKALADNYPWIKHPFMHCTDCGELKGYHHEQHCKSHL